MRAPDARVPFHSLRSALVAGTIVSLACGAHVLAGGRLPAAGILMALLALTALASTTATRFRLSAPAMAGLLGAGQFVLHAAFTALGGTLHGPADSAMTHHPAPALASAASFAHAPPTELVAPLAALMLAGHTLATLACALLLAKGEEALWLLAAWLRPLFRRPEPSAHRAVTSSPAPVRSAGPTPRPWRNLRPDCRRGPPGSPAFPRLHSIAGCPAVFLAVSGSFRLLPDFPAEPSFAANRPFAAHPAAPSDICARPTCPAPRLKGASLDEPFP